MGSYKNILDANDFAGFCDEVDRLHDGILREVAIRSRGYVDAELKMWSDADPFDMRILVQLQWAEAPCVELFLLGVSACRLAPTATTFEPEINFRDDGIVLYLGGRSLEASHFIAARELKYRILGNDCLGQQLKLIQPFPEMATPQ